MNILHLLISGGLGGIENLCKNIVLTSQENHYLCFLWEGGPIAQQLTEQGKEVFLLQEKKSAVWATQKKLRQICREKQIQVVNLQHGGPFVDLQFLLLKKAFPKIAFVSTEHCFADYYKTQLNSVLKEKLWRFSYQVKFRAADRVLAVSQGVKQSYLEQFGLPEEKVHVVYNGISQALLDVGKTHLEKYGKWNAFAANGSSYADKQQSAVSKTAGCPIRLLFVGRMDGLKGCEYLLEAMCHLEHAELTMVGDGVQRPALEQFVKEKSLTTRVNFEGYQTNLAKYFKKTDIFIYPPIFPEAFGLAPAEAMAFGIPCVVTAMGGLKEIVEDGVNGFLCKEADADSLHCTIRKMMIQCNEENAESFRQNARRTAEKFSIAHTVESLEQEYRELIEKK